MENNNLVEKLSLQAESFQEGFEILSKSFSLVEMIENFLHLLRGNFLISDIYIFHKVRTDFKWNSVVPKKKLDPIHLEYIDGSNGFAIKYFENKKFDVSIFLPLADQSFLGILIGHKMDKSEFNDLDKITLQILLQVFDAAYRTFINQKRVKALIFELNERVVQLNNLIDTVIEVSRYDKRSVIFDLALERIAPLTNASAALLQIVKENKIVQQYSFPPNLNFKEVIDSKYKIENSFDYDNLIYNFTLADKETRKGVTDFNDLDKLLLDAISRQVKASIENQFLNGQAIEKEKMEQELVVAASIQQRILPAELPKIKNYDLAGINIPSKEVGGDYYNCVDLGKGKFALIIADVAGKGIGAALLVSTLDAALYSYLEFDIPLTEMADRLNKLIYKSSPSDKYITFFIVVLDSKSGELDIVNAGHNPIFLLRKNGTLEKLDAGGVGLGMFDFGIPFTGQKSIMNSGDKLFLYTDGIPEAMNEIEEEYSDEKMIKFFLDNSDSSSKDFINDLVKDVKEYSGAALQSDDITAIILKRS
ncbi:MAG: serine/threonine-protein phosphatase [Candidatus Marinimicrobia bacterium]|nr:serine/threonine-protein phosphatase [Candidatus Neomarinimicrobiota bacterium]